MDDKTQNVKSDEALTIEVCGACRGPLHLPPQSSSSKSTDSSLKGSVSPSSAPVLTVRCINETTTPPTCASSTTAPPPKGDECFNSCLDECGDANVSSLEESSGGNGIELTGDGGDGDDGETSKKSGGGCPHPTYHLACAGIPIGSRLYRDAVREHYVRHSSSTSLRYVNEHGAKTATQKKKKKKRRSITKPPPRTPPISKRDSFDSGYLCPACDVQGTSRYLVEYFESFRKEKVEFYDGDEDAFEGRDTISLGGAGGLFVRKLISLVDSGTTSNNKGQFKASEVRLEHIGMILRGIRHRRNASSCIEEEISDINEKDDGPDAKSIMPPTQDDSGSVSDGGGGPRRSNRKRVPVISPLAAALFEDIDVTDTTISFFGMNEGKKKVSEVNGKPKDLLIDEMASSKKTNTPLPILKQVPLDPTYLVGQPIKLYCPIDNSYHVGRIIDWKTNRGDEIQHHHKNQKTTLRKLPNRTSRSSSSLPIVNTDNEIGKTRYLVRFRPDLDGRKVAVHQWIYLEEHAIAIGVALVWVDVGGENEGNKGQRERGRVSRHSRFRPAQIMVRTALEMAPVREINENGICDHVSAMAFFFGREFIHAVINLSATPSQSSESQLESDFGAADFSSPPEWLDRQLRKNGCHDRSLAVATAVACMEWEEERRVRAWHRLLALPLAPPAQTLSSSLPNPCAMSSSLSEIASGPEASSILCEEESDVDWFES